MLCVGSRNERPVPQLSGWLERKLWNRLCQWKLWNVHDLGAFSLFDRCREIIMKKYLWGGLTCLCDRPIIASTRTFLVPSCLAPQRSVLVSTVYSALGRVPSRSASIRDRPDGRQRQWKELHRRAAGGFGCRPDRLRQAGPRGVPAQHCSLPPSAWRIWVRWGNSLCAVGREMHLLMIPHTLSIYF